MAFRTNRYDYGRNKGLERPEARECAIRLSECRFRSHFRGEGEAMTARDILRIEGRSGSSMLLVCAAVQTLPRKSKNLSPSAISGHSAQRHANSVSRISLAWGVCQRVGMLRITLPKPDDSPKVFILEGELAGEWAKELIRVTREIPCGAHCVFDLEEASYVDSLGEEILRSLNRRGATFISQTAYKKDLCKRLHLHRESDVKPIAGKRLCHRQAGRPGPLHDPGAEAS